MLQVDQLETKISSLIKYQFPELYRQEGQGLILFVEQYYKWAESEGQFLFQSRNLLNSIDIDNTTDDFLSYFKNKFLSGIQFDTATDLRYLIKHSLELYQTKGTPEGIDLFFKLVFGVPAIVNYPREDLFILSSGKLVKSYYLEIKYDQDNVDFVGKMIVGSLSNATAYVESVIKRDVQFRILDIFFITNITGKFILNEVIYAQDDHTIKTTIHGSLNQVLLDAGGQGAGFTVGDIVDFYSDSGINGKGRVANIADVSGTGTFRLINGGYGYADNAEVLISDKVITVDITSLDPLYKCRSYFKTFEGLSQPINSFTYSGLLGGNVFPVSSNVYTYWPNNSIKGIGVVVSETAANVTDGSLIISLRSGNLQSSAFYSTGNVLTATQDNFKNPTAYANIIGVSNTFTLHCTNIVGVFIPNTEIFQLNQSNKEIANAIVISFSPGIGSNGDVIVQSKIGAIHPGWRVSSRANVNVNANIASVTFKIGIIDIVNNFIIYPDAICIGSNTGISVIPTVISGGVGAGFSISNDFIFSEQVNVSSNYLKFATSLIVPFDANQAIVSNFILVNKNIIVNNTPVTYYNNFNITPVNGLSNNVVYYASNANSSGLSLSATRGGTPLAINSYSILAGDSPEYFLARAPALLNAQYYDFFTQSSNSNVSSVIAPTLANSLITIGKIVSLLNLNRGRNYEDSPFVKIFQPETYAYKKLDSILSLQDSSIVGAFTVGDVIFQAPWNARGKIKSFTTNTLLVERLNLFDGNTFYSGDMQVIFYSGLSGAMGNVIPLVNVYSYFPNNLLKGYGVVTHSNAYSNTTGDILVHILSGNLYGYPLYNSGNTFTFNIDGGLVGYPNNILTTQFLSAQANITSVVPDNNTQFIGLNANIFSQTAISNGSVTNIDVVDSGFGFENTDTVFFKNDLGITSGIGVLSGVGFTQGYYASEDGFLSSGKKIHDGDYYQKFSYEVRSSVTLNKYASMLKNILHVAGTKFFSSFEHTSDAVSLVSANLGQITISTPNYIISTVNHIITESGNRITTTIGANS